MAIYSLGDFTFINLQGISAPHGAPETVRKTSVPVQRPGVAGTVIVTTGIKGRPFQMRSVVDITTRVGAQSLIATYEAAVNDEMLRVIHASADYSATPIFNQYWPLDVLCGWRRVSAMAGGLNGGLYLVEALWTLIPVYVQPEEEE